MNRPIQPGDIVTRLYKFGARPQKVIMVSKDAIWLQSPENPNGAPSVAFRENVPGEPRAMYRLLTDAEQARMRG